jgi:hypothetical protein
LRDSDEDEFGLAGFRIAAGGDAEFSVTTETEFVERIEDEFVLVRAYVRG